MNERLEINGVVSSDRLTANEIEDLFLEWVDKNDLSFDGGFYKNEEITDLDLELSPVEFDDDEIPFG